MVFVPPGLKQVLAGLSDRFVVTGGEGIVPSSFLLLGGGQEGGEHRLSSFWSSLGRDLQV